jgi:hypothetical protein
LLSKTSWEILGHIKASITMNIHLKTEGQAGKTDPIRGWEAVGEGRVNRESEGGRI